MTVQQPPCHATHYDPSCNLSFTQETARIHASLICVVSKQASSDHLPWFGPHPVCLWFALDRAPLAFSRGPQGPIPSNLGFFHFFPSSAWLLSVSIRCWSEKWGFRLFGAYKTGNFRISSFPLLWFRLNCWFPPTKKIELGSTRFSRKQIRVEQAHLEYCNKKSRWASSTRFWLKETSQAGLMMGLNLDLWGEKCFFGCFPAFLNAKQHFTHRHIWSPNTNILVNRGTKRVVGGGFGAPPLAAHPFGTCCNEIAARQWWWETGHHPARKVVHT